MDSGSDPVTPLIKNSYRNLVSSRRYALGFYLTGGLLLAIVATSLEKIGLSRKVLIIGAALLVFPLNWIFYWLATLLRQTDSVRTKTIESEVEVSNVASASIAEPDRTRELSAQHEEQAIHPSSERRRLVAIDFGSSKTRVLVAEITQEAICYRAHSVAESRGWNNGVITDFDKAWVSIRGAVESAEDMAGVPIKNATVSIGGRHVQGFNSRGEISFGARSREIGMKEIRQAVDKARIVPLPADREILHLLPQEFILDDQPGVQDPIGMMATRLEVRVHIVTASSSATQNLVTAVNRAGVHVDDTIFGPLACADSVLRSDERELGVCLVDLGAGACDLVVFQQGAVLHTAVIPIGGDHFTRDLSVGMCTGLADAEMLKKNFGNLAPTVTPEANEVEVPSVGDRPPRMMPQRMVGEILEPRARELFELLRDNLRAAGVLEHCIAGFVLSGGGSRLPGILDVAESVLRKGARLAWPKPLEKMPPFLAEPEFATVLGLICYSDRASRARGLPELVARYRSADLAPLWKVRSG